MLVELQRLLENSSGGLTFGEIARQLDAPPGLLLAMLDTLAQKGRLLEVGPDGGICQVCGAASQCQLLALKGARYIMNDG